MKCSEKIRELVLECRAIKDKIKITINEEEKRQLIQQVKKKDDEIMRELYGDRNYKRFNQV